MMKSTATLSRVTISLPADLAQTLLSLRLTHAVSVSAIAETAIRSFLEAHAQDDLRSLLKEKGAGLRRRSIQGEI
jgi:metal-responsive CopG/Arc/MetJ family transcriptional regulator